MARMARYRSYFLLNRRQIHFLMSDDDAACNGLLELTLSDSGVDMNHCVKSVDPNLELPAIAQQAGKLLEQLNALWNLTGFLVDTVNEEEVKQKQQLSYEVLEPIERRIRDATALRAEQEALILSLSKKATLLSYSLAISLSLCQVSY